MTKKASYRSFKNFDLETLKKREKNMNRKAVHIL